MSAQEIIDLVSQVVCVPIMIILNYSLFQYLLTVFFSRRRDPHVRLLLTAAFFSFATLIPFAYPSENLVHNLNDISEVCSVLTFTQQIAMLTRDVNKKMKLPTIAKLGRIAELLVFTGLTLLTANIVSIVAPEAEGMDTVEVIDTVIEYVTVWFVVAFRIYFLSVVRGWRHVWQHQKLEVLYYLLFLTHGIPFQIVKDILDLDLTHIQGLWMRITIALCLSSSIRARILSISSRNGSKSTGHGGSDRNLKINRQVQRSSVVPSGSRMDWSLSEHSGPDSTAVQAIESSHKRRRGSNGDSRKSSVSPPANAISSAKPSLVGSLMANRSSRSNQSIRGEAVGVRGLARAASIRLASGAKVMRSVAPTR